MTSLSLTDGADVAFAGTCVVPGRLDIHTPAVIATRNKAACACVPLMTITRSSFCRRLGSVRSIAGIRAERRPVCGDHARVKPRAGLRHAPLRLEVHVHDAEALGESERPFQVVQQRPGEIALHVAAVAD